jgi:hypothetical protein
MKKIFSFAALLLFLNTALPQSPVINLRGQIRTIDPATQATVAVPKITVDLYKKDHGAATWVLVATTISDQNGFYYFNRVATGNYFIQINKRRNYDIVVVPIDERRQQFLDLPLLIY